MSSLSVVALAAVASGLELTKANFDEMTSDKTVFIKFYAPWCGHCKTMKPDWEKLMEQYAENKEGLVAEVNCDGTGKDLCEEHGIQGFPTLKYGSPDALEDYQGARTLDDLKKFAEENLKPMCSVKRIDLCSEEKKEQIENFQKMDQAEIDKLVKEKEDLMAKKESDFKAFLEGLQKQYVDANKKKDEEIKEIRDSGLSIMKAIAKSKQAAKEEL